MIKRIINALKRMYADGSNETKVHYLRNQGMHIGNDCVINGGGVRVWNGTVSYYHRK